MSHPQTLAGLRAYIEELKRGPPESEPERFQLPPPPEYPFERRLHKVAPSPPIRRPRLSLDEARALIDEEMRAYLSDPDPQHVLLIRASPGTGKTTIAVNVAHDVAETGRRVMYAAPRHNFYADIEGACYFHGYDPRLWYEWQPRKERDPETCQHTEAITRWMAKGYDAMPFCSGVCGWDYVNEDCVYHGQKQRKETLIMAQHAHVTLGHPLGFDVVFGDESPLGAFLHKRTIHTDDLIPAAMDSNHPFCALLMHVQNATNSPEIVEGEEWWSEQYLGNPAAVLDLCEQLAVPLDAIVDPPQPRSVEDADRADVWYLHQFAAMLGREAKLASEGKSYVHRVKAGGGKLWLLMRHSPNNRLPPHVIWMDATGNERVYESLFGKEVKVVGAEAELRGNVYQVYDRANGISSMRDVEHVPVIEKGKVKHERIATPTTKAEQAARFVETICDANDYERPAVVTFSDIEHLFGDDVAHFYGARGSNALKPCDAIFVVGAPMSNIKEILTTAAMVFYERNVPFSTRWHDVNREYIGYLDGDGQGRAYPVGGYWGDADLETIVSIHREDEILQAAHRARPILSPVDVWLVTNIPVPELPPDALVNMRETLGVPAGVNLWKWLDLMEAVEGIDTVTTKIITEECGINWRTAAKYLDLLIESGEWREYDKDVDGDIAIRNTGGRPPKTLVRR